MLHDSQPFAPLILSAGRCMRGHVCLTYVEELSCHASLSVSALAAQYTPTNYYSNGDFVDSHTMLCQHALLRARCHLVLIVWSGRLSDRLMLPSADIHRLTRWNSQNMESRNRTGMMASYTDRGACRHACTLCYYCCTMLKGNIAAASFKRSASPLTSLQQPICMLVALLACSKGPRSHSDACTASMNSIMKP